MKPAEARSWAREHYGLDVQVRPLAGEVDRNFLLSEADGSRHVLKIAPTTISREEIGLQLAALEHLGGGPDSAVVPHIRRTLAGEVMTSVVTADEQSCLLRMVGFIEGHPMVEMPGAPLRLLDDLGSLLGRLDRELLSFDHPGAHRRIVWDMTRVLELEPLLPAIADRTARSAVATGLQHFRERVMPHLAELPRSVVHNDANDHNVLVTSLAADQACICGLIDFGDMVYTLTAAELAIACTYAMLEADDVMAIADAVIAGYSRELPLSSRERDLIPDLIVARLCASLLMSAQARLLEPDDDYLRITEEPARRLLERML